ncbi:hypothetical protein AMELA_G00171410 [Ameiurus melas]|uniref:Uncharacterized protein n=1 Tax=Ameiurus melas TaxID=219545 RepID=A0A7J6AG55_AMEME|nr:hypothetical protein AMELA_G00171410 [Ameiurus melas]
MFMSDAYRPTQALVPGFQKNVEAETVQNISVNFRRDLTRQYDLLHWPGTLQSGVGISGSAAKCAPTAATRFPKADRQKFSESCLGSMISLKETLPSRSRIVHHSAVTCEYNITPENI